MPLFEIDAKRPALVRASASARGFGTDAQRVVDGNLDSLLGEQIFPVAQGASAAEPYLVALDAAGLPVVIDVVTHLTEGLLTEALNHAGGAGNLTRAELAEKYAGGAPQFDRDVAAFYDNVPITRSTAARRQGARLIVICQSVEPGILDALDFLRQPGSPVAVLRLNVVHTADGRRFIDVSPLAISRDLGRPAVSSTLLESTTEFAEGVAVGRALTGKQPVVVRVPHRPDDKAAQASGPPSVPPAMASRAERRRAQQEAIDSTRADATRGAPAPAADADVRAAGAYGPAPVPPAVDGGAPVPSYRAPEADDYEVAASAPDASSVPAPTAYGVPPAEEYGSSVPAPRSHRVPDPDPYGERKVDDAIEEGWSTASGPAPQIPDPPASFPPAAPAASDAYAAPLTNPVPAAENRAEERDRLASRLSRRAARESAHRPTDVPVFDTPPPTRLDREPSGGSELGTPGGASPEARQRPDRAAGAGAGGAAGPGAHAEAGPGAHAEGAHGADFAGSLSAGSPDAGVFDGVHGGHLGTHAEGAPGGAAYPTAPGDDSARRSAAYPDLGQGSDDLDYPADATIPSVDPAFRRTSTERQAEAMYAAPDPVGGPPTDETRVAAPAPSVYSSPGASGTTRRLSDPPIDALGPEDDPDLIDLAAQIGRPVPLVWARPRRGQRFEAMLHPDGYIELADGERFRHPDLAAVAASGSASADGWSVWRLGDDGPTLTDEFRFRHT